MLLKIPVLVVGTRTVHVRMTISYFRIYSTSGTGIVGTYYVSFTRSTVYSECVVGSPNLKICNFDFLLDFPYTTNTCNGWVVWSKFFTIQCKQLKPQTRADTSFLI
jgi:hypothetical protein